MGGACSAAAGALAGWSRAGLADARHPRCDLPGAAWRHALAHAAALSSAAPDGLSLVRRLPRRRFAFVVRAFADAAYIAGRGADATCIAIGIVRKPPDQKGLALHPRRWVVERCFAWLGRN
jgi:hypothetical protein